MRRYKIIAIPLIAAIIGAWVFQYININQYFRKTYPLDIQTYQIGEFVPWDEDVLSRNTLTGYEIQVESAMIMDVAQFFELYHASDENVPNLPEKVCDVEITVRNVGTDADVDILGLFLPDLALHGIDYTTDWNSELMWIANPEMGEAESLGITVPPGYQHTAHIIYNLRRMHFSSFTWSHLKEYAFYITISDYPTRKEIQLAEIQFVNS